LVELTSFLRHLEVRILLSFIIHQLKEVLGKVLPRNIARVEFGLLLDNVLLAVVEEVPTRGHR
jgi:hypothetical protein